MTKPHIHLIGRYVAGAAWTRCGRYVRNENVTGYAAQATCPRCNPKKRKKP